MILNGHYAVFYANPVDEWYVVWGRDGTVR